MADDHEAQGRRWAVTVLLLCLVVLMAAAVVTVRFGLAGDDTDPPVVRAPSSSVTRRSASPGSGGFEESTSIDPTPGRGDPGRALLSAACDGTLTSSRSAPVADAGLVEVSGVVVDGQGVRWVINDSGDSARLFGLRTGDDGRVAVQEVAVTGAENLDWEDMAIHRSPSSEEIWLADTGDNQASRATVSLYRIAVPEAGAAEVAATRTEVAYPDGPHDVEAVAATPDGAVLLFTKEPGRSRLYRVPVTVPGVNGPGLPGPITAELLGEFPVGDGESSLLTGADMSARGDLVVLRTYGSVFVVGVPEGSAVIEALADESNRCRALPPVELQGEAIALTEDARGYVTVGEGKSPRLTTVLAPAP